MIFYKTAIKMIFSCSLFLSSLTYAENITDTCYIKTEADPRVISSCLDKIINVTDRELQAWVNLHQFDLEEKGSRSALKSFKRSQSNFTTYRESNCHWQYLVFTLNETAGLAYKKCYISLNQQRINELSRFFDIVNSKKNND
jgi:uncharacterized protein YecT (DUF1311 family)